MTGEVVEYHEIAWTQGGREDLLDVGEEDLAIDGSIEDKGSGQAGEPEAGDECRGLPVSVRHKSEHPLAPEASPEASSHVRGRPGFVDEDELGGVQLGLSGAPLGSSGCDIGP